MRVHRGEFPSADAVRESFSAGSRRLEYRDITLTPEQYERALDPGFMRRLSDAIPKGERREIRIRGAAPDGRRFDMRIERDRRGMTHVLVDGARFPDAARARDYLSGLGRHFDRVDMRGMDSDGRRIHMEAREGRFMDHRNQQRPEDRHERGSDRERMERRHESMPEREPRQRPEPPDRGDMRHERR